MALSDAHANASPAVFLDKDGTLVDDLPFNVDPARIRLARGAGVGLPLLSRAGYRLVVISNQPGIALGLFAESALDAVHDRLRSLLGDLGVRLDGFYYCPHAAPAPGESAGCTCRKPAPGLIERAGRELRISLGRSWMVGDILDDVEAGRRAGCRTLLIDNGNETEWREGLHRHPHVTAPDLAAAARTILASDRRLVERERARA